MKLALIAVFVLAASPAWSQATRTWVSGVGDDVNPCSRTAPCKTFAGAISKTARGGEINALDAGGFGAVTITKSITLTGSGWGSILASGTNGVVVNIVDPADATKSVRIRGLAINGAGTGLAGIKVLAADKVVVEDAVIDGFTGDAVSVAGKCLVHVKSSTLSNNAGAGVSVKDPSGQAALSGVSLLFNGTGVEALNGGSVASFGDNVFFGNGKDGASAALPRK